MSANYYELLKYAQTGIASPDMTYYDKLRASTLMGGVVQTLTGQPPLTFKADGTPLISWSMKGNGQQTGTPTPDNPVMPEFVGVRTKNLLAANGTVTINKVSVTIASGHFLIVGTTNSEISSTNTAWKALDFTLPAGTYRFKTDALNGVGFYIKNYETSAQLASRDTSFTLEAETHCYISFRVWNNNGVTNLKPMLNSGSTALPYEPFGYKIPISCAGQTVPVYLGQTQTVRRIMKLVLDGTESSWGSGTSTVYLPKAGDTNAMLQFSTVVSSHYAYHSGGTSSAPNNSVYTNAGAGTAIWFKTDYGNDVNSFKTYLAAQYAAGTPVTVWYVLNTPETGIVNEPLCKIGTYADELHSTDTGVTIPTAKGSNTLTVDTPIQPSEMTITFKG